ncbi:hypothetical protein IEN85_11120 [Pelagicoccus sp. NFK12]|uniref:Uncharacterized protein n=1 Tax=Pelagicoccus enzymogenes TaxID=2773457 RepID=A0A927F971_9BACT|nr:hypothetical protein [Pelagicoccus enzymogenes]MBD5780041.1 hypothetical protein [Pelagicoccus enzymogenes]
MSILPRIVLLFSILALSTSYAAAQADDDDMLLIEIEGFEVFSNNMRIIDGLSGKEYTGDHPVILGFRREFDTILTKYHNKLLVDEAKRLKERAEVIKPFSEELAALSSYFGIEDFKITGPHLTRELSIFKRMAQDPFFNIEELVVWDLHSLQNNPTNIPANKYAKNIRFNQETGEWERRVITKWEVSWVSPDRHRRQIYKFKEQGLNLETQRGFHFSAGLRADVPSTAFQEVKLQYPIFYNTGEPVDAQIRKLKENFLLNLIYIYDPYSWVLRGNVRFRRGFHRQLHSHIKTQSLPIKDRDWFDRVLAHFLHDLATIRFWGVDEIYDLQILSEDKTNKHQLGTGLDLLNWNKADKREIDFDPEEPQTVPHISFDNPHRARYVLLDAYRRYGDTFLDALVSRFHAIEGRTSGKQLVRDAIEDASGVSADKYIPAAIKAQRSELKRFLRN